MNFNNYQPQTIKGTLCIWLQYVGFHQAKKAEELKAGEKIVFNFGIAYQVIEVAEVSNAFLSVKTLCPKGVEYTSRMKKTRLVAFA